MLAPQRGSGAIVMRVLTKQDREVAAEFRRLTNAATQVDCRECGALAGDVCVTHDVAQLTPHMSRFMDARSSARKQRWSA